MDIATKKMHELFMKDPALSKSIQFIDFEFMKLDLKGSLSELSKTSREKLTPFARDGSGGIFCLEKSDLSVVFIDGHGSAGFFARNFDEAIYIICSFPYSWHDMIAAGHSEELLRATHEEIEKDIEGEIAGTSELSDYYESIDFDARSHYLEGRKLARHILEKLKAEPDEDPVKCFLAGLNKSPKIVVTGRDGEEMEQLVVAAA